MDKLRVILVHGFNVRDKGADTIDRLRPHFEERGYQVIEAVEGFRFLLGVRFFNKFRARKLMRLIQPGDILVGHSDGCNIITMACTMLSRGGFPHLSLLSVFYNPALDQNTWQPGCVDKVLVFHDQSDKATWISKLLPFHNWGEMGKKGYAGPQWEIHTNVSYDRMGFANLGHSGVFKNEQALQETLLRFDRWRLKTCDKPATKISD